MMSSLDVEPCLLDWLLVDNIEEMYIAAKLAEAMISEAEEIDSRLFKASDAEEIDSKHLDSFSANNTDSMLI